MPCNHSALKTPRIFNIVKQYNMEDLPDEVLEYILSLVPPYNDLQECSLVCKRWNRSVKNVIRHTQKKLHRAITDFNVSWEDMTPLDMSPSITKRYSHSACCYGNSMYVFGGCTSTSTTFNDMWRLDLNKRQWIRPLTMGTYPSPKACASLVCYEDSLYLFGGWTHPSPYPLHQGWRLFNELHMYSILSNRWTCITTTSNPPSMAGHSATVQGDIMVIFGGLHKTNSLGQYMSSNDVWQFNLKTQKWNKQATTDPKPHARYGQSQICVDEKNILVLGGCGGPNMVFSDVWLLTITDSTWIWKEVQVENPQWAAAHMWCHPACKIGQQVVVFSRNPISGAPPTLSYTAHWNTPTQLRMTLPNVWVPPAEDPLQQQAPAQNQRQDEGREPRNVDRDPNVNGRRGSLNRRAINERNSSSDDSETEMAESQGRNVLQQKFSEHVADLGGVPSLGMAAFRDTASLPRRNNRIRQRLESLRRAEERYSKVAVQREPDVSPPSTSRKPPACVSTYSRNPVSKNGMAMYVLDISRVLAEDCYVQWLPVKTNIDVCVTPEEIILYTLVAGTGELIMFGGIQKDATSITAQTQLSGNSVSNTAYFISAPKGVI